MKQSAKTVTLTGFAGAVAFAGASQAYGTVVSVATPTNIVNAPLGTGVNTKREYWNVDTGATTTTAAAGYDINFGLLNSSTYNEFFTGLAVANGATTGGGSVSYLASNGTIYAYGLTAGSTVGTGGKYATFQQSASAYTIMSLIYAGTPYAIMQPGNPYYVGFKFTAADGLLHDGWVQLQSDYNTTTQAGSLTFLAAAYNTTPDAQGGQVIVGSFATPVPEPGTLSALALGAAVLTGVGLKRRRRAALAAQA